MPMNKKPNQSETESRKKRFSISPVAIFCALALSVPTVTQAGALDAMLEGVYTNTTDSGAFQSQRMGHFQGGSFYARFPTKSINVAMFDPPRIQAGCGGIDLFGGSFSFVSGEEIVQILRSIGQNALGLLFQMGIQAISQPLSALLSHWSDKLQAMNQSLRNTCAAANKLVSIVTDGPTQDFGAMRESMKGTFSGFFTDSFNAFKSGKAQARENSLWTKLSQWGDRSENATIDSDKKSNENDIRNDPNNGNSTWKALTNSKSYKRVSDVINTKTQERQIKELIINMGGTRINAQFKDDTRQKCSPSDGVQCDLNPILEYTTRLLTPADLKEVTTQSPKDILRCKDTDGVNHSGDHLNEDMACTTMEYVQLGEVFKGAAYYINRALFGSTATHILTQSEIDNMVDSGRGLIGKGLNANTTLPSDEERAVLENTSIPFLAHLFYLQVDPQAQKNALNMVYNLMIEKYAYMIGQNLLEAARGAYIGGETKVLAQKPNNYDANLEAFALDLSKMAISTEREIKVNMDLNAIREYVERNAISKAVSNRVTSNNSAN
jgi:conjugative transfer pilus assembly protein TraH